MTLCDRWRAVKKLNVTVETATKRPWPWSWVWSQKQSCRPSLHRTFSPSRPGYLLCRLPEVSWVGEPAVQLGQLLQHVGQLGEGGPLPQVVGPAGREDFLGAQQQQWAEQRPSPAWPCWLFISGLVNSQWPPCRGWSPPGPSWCPPRCPPAR